MSMQKVVDTILSRAKAEAETILAGVRSQIDAEQAKHQTELDRYREQTRQMTEAAAEDRKARMLAAARMEFRKETLAAKGQLLDEIFSRAKMRILSLPEDQYQELMLQLLVRTIRSGDERVRIGRGETRIHEKWIKLANRRLGPGFKGNIQLDSERAQIEGGFILVRGKVQVNAGIDVLIEQVRRRLEMDLSKELFES